MSTQLDLYNEALLFCGERALSSLTEEREPRRLLDQVWAQNGVKNCLEQGQWHFAMRTVQLDYDSTIEPDFGYRRAFSKPSDWVLTSALCAEEYFRVPLTRYFDEAGYWYAELDTIYVRYVSNSTSYGMNIGAWPESFRQFVACHFATKICLKTTNDNEKFKNLMALRANLLRTAKSKSAMAEPTSFEAQGSWSRARMRWLNRRDGGNTGGNLIG